MTNETLDKQIQAPVNDVKPTEVLVGYDGYYNFQIAGQDKKSIPKMFSTTGWDKGDFYGAGRMVANWMHELNTANSTINNGQIYNRVYNIPESESSRMHTDDPFWSGRSHQAYHFEKVECRALLPEQLDLFKEGLEYQLQVLKGEISESPREQKPLTEAELLFTHIKAQQPALNILKEDMVKDLIKKGRD